MFIEEPSKQEKRRFKRAKFGNPVSFRLKEGGSFSGCLAHDISEGGMRVQVNDFLPVNTEMILQSRIPQTSKVIDVAGRITWLQRVPFSDRYQVGLQFTQTNSAVQEEIRSYVRSQSSN